MNTLNPLKWWEHRWMINVLLTSWFNDSTNHECFQTWLLLRYNTDSSLQILRCDYWRCAHCDIDAAVCSPTGHKPKVCFTFFYWPNWRKLKVHHKRLGSMVLFIFLDKVWSKNATKDPFVCSTRLLWVNIKTTVKLAFMTFKVLVTH